MGHGLACSDRSRYTLLMDTTYRVSHKIGDDGAVSRIATSITAAAAAAVARKVVARLGGVAWVIGNQTDTIINEVR